MNIEFPVYSGHIKFIGDEIHVKDGIFKWHRTLRMIYSWFFIFAGISVATWSIKSDRLLFIILGIALLVIGVLGVILGMQVNTSTVLNFRQVERALIYRDRVSSLNLALYLKNSQKRKIILDSKDEDRFWEIHIQNLINTLKGLKIPTEIR